MKVVSVDVFVYQYEGSDRDRAIGLAVDHRHFNLIGCRVLTDEGIVGSGYGWCLGNERGALIAAAVKAASTIVIGKDPRRVEDVWDAYLRFSSFLSHSGLAIIGMSVVDMALWDIKARAVEMPLWLYLGGHKDKARAYSSHLSLVQREDGGMVDKFVHGIVEDVLSRGYRELKIWIEHPSELRFVREIVNTYSGGIRWAVDVVQRWDVRTSIRAIRSVEDLDLLWIEDPVHFDDVTQMARVAKAVGTPICTGENSYYLLEARELMENTTVQYISLDLMRCGGISGWLKIAAAAEGRDVRIVSHTYQQVARHLVCATRNADFVEVWPTYDDLVGSELEVKDGTVAAPDDPGIGLTFADRVLSGGETVKVT